MKAPIKCPICDDAMLNIFSPAEDLHERVTKSCTNKIDHKLNMIVDGNEVSQMSLDLGNGQEAIWLFTLNAVWVQSAKYNKNPINTVVLPFFEPDLSNYKKLVEKVKTYLVFS